MAGYHKEDLNEGALVPERRTYLLKLEVLPASQARDDWHAERWSAPDAVRLRLLLKEALRRHGFRCSLCEEVSPAAQEGAIRPPP